MNDAISLRFIRSIFQDFGGYELMSPVAGRWPVNDQPVFITCKEGKGDQMAYLNVEGDNVLGIRYFTATSTMGEIGKFDSGKIWVRMEGEDLSGSRKYIECHFEKSWEDTLKNLFDTENKKVVFSGKIAFYKQYWLVAEECEIDNY